MFGIGSTELMVILVVALVVLGPKSLPGIAKTLGKVMGEFRRVSTEFQRTMNAEVAQDEHEKLKKEAEEELFGKDKEKDDVATTSKVASNSSQVKENSVADVKDDDAKSDVAQEKSSSVSESQTCQENTATTIDMDTPLAKAVAEAEALANAGSDKVKDDSNKG